MTDILVNDAGFHEMIGAAGVQVQADEVPEALFLRLDGVEMIEIAFPAMADGRGFSIARRLRELGYEGHILATGAVVCDQYRHLRQTGFDGVRLSAEQAQKMPEDAWLSQAKRLSASYQARLIGRHAAHETS